MRYRRDGTATHCHPCGVSMFGKGRIDEPNRYINNFPRQSPRKNFYIRSAQGQVVIRGRARDAGRRLDHIQPVHRVVWAVQLAAPRKFSCIPDVPWAAAQEIGGEREEDFAFLRAINSSDLPAGGKLRALARPVAASRLPLMPLGA